MACVPLLVTSIVNVTPAEVGVPACTRMSSRMSTIVSSSGSSEAKLPVVQSRRPLWDFKHPDDPDWKYE